MIITEPKTPFVRYNPETDEVMDLDSESPPPSLTFSLPAPEYRGFLGFPVLQRSLTHIYSTSLAEIPGFELGNPAQVDADNYAQALALIAKNGLPSSNASNLQRSGSVVSSSGTSGGYGSRRGSSSSEKMVKVDVPGGLSSDPEDDEEMADEESECSPFSPVRLPESWCR